MTVPARTVAYQAAVDAAIEVYGDKWASVDRSDVRRHAGVSLTDWEARAGLFDATELGWLTKDDDADPTVWRPAERAGGKR